MHADPRLQEAKCYPRGPDGPLRDMRGDQVAQWPMRTMRVWRQTLDRAFGVGPVRDPRRGVRHPLEIFGPRGARYLARVVAEDQLPEARILGFCSAQELVLFAR